jgi:hypothetical protein
MKKGVIMEENDEIIIKTGKKAKKNSLDLENVLSQIGDGTKLEVFRVFPNFCDGQVGTFEIDPNEPISVDEIRQRWGGRKLRITLRKANGDYILSRHLSFPDPPREEGVELVPGPTGSAIRIDRLNAQTKTTEEKKSEFPLVASSMNDALIKTLIDAQTQQSQSIQNMLVNRLNHLENIIEKRSTDHFVGPAQAISQDTKPFDGIRDTIKVIKEMEEIRAVLQVQTGSAGPPESSPWSGAIEKMLDFVLEREKMNAQVKHAQMMAVAAPHPLPPANLSALSGAAPEISDAQLVDLWQKRLIKLPPEKKAEIMQLVLGDELEDVISYIPEPDNKDENDSCADNETDLQSDLVSAEDRALLGENGSKTKE